MPALKSVVPVQGSDLTASFSPTPQNRNYGQKNKTMVKTLTDLTDN